MQTVEQNDAASLLDDYVTLEYILVGDLRELLESNFDPATTQWTVAVVDALLEMLPRQFRLKDSGGYLAEVVDRCPDWSDRVDELREERQAVYAKLRMMRGRLIEQGPPAAATGLADILRRDLRDWMTTLVAHRRRERRLVQNAFNVEVGVGD